MNERKKKRRIAYLMFTLSPAYAETWRKLKGWNYVKDKYEKYEELEELTKEMTNSERVDVWLDTFRGNKHAYFGDVNYRAMPKPEYKDNKTYKNSRNSNYGRNRNKIRYPKKKRKTAWKRFYRLFPYLKPD